jgi:hypothetical protein
MCEIYYLPRICGCLLFTVVWILSFIPKLILKRGTVLVLVLGYYVQFHGFL